jgi:hypothetical protein
MTRDDPRYWNAVPDDHNVVGLFAIGPQMTEPVTNRLARLTRSTPPERPEGPLGARQRMEREQRQKIALYENQQRFLSALRGKSAPRARRGFVHRAA